LTAVFERARERFLDSARAEEAWHRLHADVERRPVFELAVMGPPRVDLQIQSFQLAGEGPDAVGLLLHDVTADREIVRTKDEMINIVSHELRTPLTSLMGFAELLLARNYSEEQRTKFLKTMVIEGQRLHTLISDFLDLQRMQIGMQTLQKAPIDIGQLVEHAVASAGPDPAHPTIVDVQSPCFAVGSEDRLLQVVLNLLSNARKYSPDGGEVRVAARQTPEAVEVAVTDVGLGLPPEAYQRLFSKFYRVETAERRSISGTGLGLAICKEIVEAHGGRIWASSEGPGRGSTFAFSIPTDPSVAETRPTPAVG
jgi:signal transduction histidine kinase